MIAADRTVPGDWYTGTIPENVEVDETALIETSFSFHFFRSRRLAAARIGRGSSVYLATMFDVGEMGEVQIGDFVLINGARIICDSRLEIGDYSLISWGVVLMDTRRRPIDREQRRHALERLPTRDPRRLGPDVDARPIRIGRNVWLGFEVCVLPGVTIGEGAVVGARSVVADDVPPYTIVGGNPARVIRTIDGSGTTGTREHEADQTRRRGDAKTRRHEETPTPVPTRPSGLRVSASPDHRTRITTDNEQAPSAPGGTIDP